MKKQTSTKQKSSNGIKPVVSGSAFSDEVEQMVNQIWRLSRYSQNHDNIMYNFQDIGKLVRAFREKHYR